jgi:hypothetical protein
LVRIDRKTKPIKSMKPSLRSFIAIGTVILGLAATSSVHAGQGAAYWQNRVTTKSATTTPTSSKEVVAKSSDQAIQPSGDACTSSCCTVSKSGS